jgi:hypothetical protein
MNFNPLDLNARMIEFSASIFAIVLPFDAVLRGLPNGAI